MNDAVSEKYFMEGDNMYDSTDIWRAVQKELRQNTNYGVRTAESALDLAWTIADQARGVFKQRTLHPQLQFIQMFKTEVNEIVSWKSFAIVVVCVVSLTWSDIQAWKGIVCIQIEHPSSRERE
jgi:hypothetical protein